MPVAQQFHRAGMRGGVFKLTFMASAVLASAAMAQAPRPGEGEGGASAAADPVLPTVEVSSGAQRDDGYAATTAPAVLRSEASLFDTPQSISVITRQQLEEKQVKSVAEALEGVAGVSAGAHGRRGWDDFIIRGQISSAQTYMDGLRIQTSTQILRAEDIAGIESIEVVKGPTSAGFGLTLPGGLVNLTTKRPQDETFYRGTLSYGNYGFKEATFDLNQARHESEKGAFRLVGRILDQDDPVDHVYFKSKYIAPSYNFDLGPRDKLSVIASYQHRRYMRNQGVPHNNTTTYRNYSRSLFIGEPDRSYEVDVYRLGANYAHYFDSDWVFKQNFAVTRSTSWSDSAFARGTGSSFPLINREINYQDKQDSNYALDSHLQRSFDFGRVNYDVMVGLDLMKERSDYFRHIDIINPLNADNPVYGVTSLREGRPGQELTYSEYAGLYLRNTIRIDRDWIIDLAGRHDWTRVEVNELLKNTSVSNSDQAFTGSASVMYQLNDAYAPYLSYATSFMPVTSSGQHGELLDPETGRQVEIGLKFQALDRRLQGYLAYYDLVRENVTESDPSSTYSVQTGEQTTRGLEAEIAASLTARWNVSAAYSYIPTAKTTESLVAGDIGQRINHVPRHSGSLWTQYYFSPDKSGWHVGAGLRFQSLRNAQRGSSSIDLPSHTLFDLNVGYEARSWGAGLSIKNAFDKDYIQGTTPNAQLITYGSPRTLRLNLKFKY